MFRGWQSEKQSRKVKGYTKLFVCELCDVRCTSAIQLAEHSTGTRHMHKLRSKNPEQALTTSPDTSTREKKLQSKRKHEERKDSKHKDQDPSPTTSPDTSAREKKLRSKHKHEESKDGKHKDQDPCLASPEARDTDKDIMYPGSTASCDSSTSQQAPSIEGPIDPEEAIVCPGSPASCDSSSSEQAPYAQDSDCSKPFVSREETTEKVKCGPPALCVSFNSEHGRTVQDCSFPTSMAPEEEDSDDFACEVAASPTSFDFSSSVPTLTLEDQDGNYLSSLKLKKPSRKKRRKHLHDQNGNSQSPLNFMSPLSVPSNFAQATESDNEEDTTLPSGVSVKCEEDHVNDEVYGLCTPLTLESNDALFNVLKNFEIRNQSDVAFILKVSQKLTSALKSFESQDIKIKEETL